VVTCWPGLFFLGFVGWAIGVVGFSEANYMKERGSGTTISQGKDKPTFRGRAPSTRRLHLRDSGQQEEG